MRFPVVQKFSGRAEAADAQDQPLRVLCLPEELLAPPASFPEHRVPLAFLVLFFPRPNVPEALRFPTSTVGMGGYFHASLYQDYSQSQCEDQGFSRALYESVTPTWACLCGQKTLTPGDADPTTPGTALGLGGRRRTLGLSGLHIAQHTESHTLVPVARTHPLETRGNGRASPEAMGWKVQVPTC